MAENTVREEFNHIQGILTLACHDATRTAYYCRRLGSSYVNVITRDPRPSPRRNRMIDRIPRIRNAACARTPAISQKVLCVSLTLPD